MDTFPLLTRKKKKRKEEVMSKFSSTTLKSEAHFGLPATDLITKADKKHYNALWLLIIIMQSI